MYGNFMVHSGGLRPAAGIDGFIQLRNLSFAYPTRPDVKIFQDVNLDIPAGTVLAVVSISIVKF